MGVKKKWLAHIPFIMPIYFPFYFYLFFSSIPFLTAFIIFFPYFLLISYIFFHKLM